MSINLMPWREQRRKQRQKDFLTKLGLSAATALGVVVVGAALVAHDVNGQRQRNSYLDAKIKSAQKDIAEIKTLEKRREQMLGRKQVIEQLQADRDLVPHVFYELASRAVDGILVTGYEHKNNILSIKGRSTSNSAVAAYMRNIEQSSWFDKPEIVIIQNKEDVKSAPQKPVAGAATLINRYEYDFVVRMGVKNPNTPVVDADLEQKGNGNAQNSNPQRRKRNTPTPNSP